MNHVLVYFLWLNILFLFVFKGEAVTGELSKLLDEIKLCQEKDYSLEELCHTASDHYLDNVNKVSEEEPMTNGSQAKPSIVSPIECDLQYNPVHVYLEVILTDFNGTYSQERVYRITSLAF